MLTLWGRRSQGLLRRANGQTASGWPDAWPRGGLKVLLQRAATEAAWGAALCRAQRYGPRDQQSWWRRSEVILELGEGNHHSTQEHLDR